MKKKSFLFISLVVILAIIIGVCLMIQQSDHSEETDNLTRIPEASTQETDLPISETQTCVATDAETEPLIMGNGYGVLIHDDGTFTVGLLNGEEKTFEPRSTTVRDLERIQAGMTFFDAVACGGIPHDGLTSGRVSTCFNASDGSSCLVYWTYNGDGEMIVSGVHIYS